MKTEINGKAGSSRELTLSVRDCLESDMEEITTIYAEAVLSSTCSFELEPPAADEMAKRFRVLTGSGYPFLVAVHEKQITAYAYAGAYRPRPAYTSTVEDSIYVHTDFRGRGIGNLLLARLIDRCSVLGFRQMIAVIGGDSPEASIGLHSRNGFSLAGTLQSVGWKHGKWLDTVIMQRALGPGSSSCWNDLI